jgi:hypothetical protein
MMVPNSVSSIEDYCFRCCFVSYFIILQNYVTFIGKSCLSFVLHCHPLSYQSLLIILRKGVFQNAPLYHQLPFQVLLHQLKTFVFGSALHYNQLQFQIDLLFWENLFLWLPINLVFTISSFSNFFRIILLFGTVKVLFL